MGGKTRSPFLVERGKGWAALEKLEELMDGADLDISHARCLGRAAGCLAALGWLESSRKSFSSS
jgi:hypothetical protein